MERLDSRTRRIGEEQVDGRLGGDSLRRLIVTLLVNFEARSAPSQILAQPRRCPTVPLRDGPLPTSIGEVSRKSANAGVDLSDAARRPNHLHHFIDKVRGDSSIRLDENSRLEFKRASG